MNQERDGILKTEFKAIPSAKVKSALRFSLQIIHEEDVKCGQSKLATRNTVQHIYYCRENDLVDISMYIQRTNLWFNGYVYLTYASANIWTEFIL